MLIQNNRKNFQIFLMLVLALATLSLIYPLVLSIFIGFIFVSILTFLPERFTLLQKMKTNARALLITFVFSVAVLTPVALITFIGARYGIEALQSIKENKSTNERIPFVGDSKETVEQKIQSNKVFKILVKNLPLNKDSILSVFDRILQSLWSSILSFLQNILTSIPDLLISIVIIILVIFFVLRDLDSFKAGILINPFFSTGDTKVLAYFFRDVSFTVAFASMIAAVTQALLLAVACIVTGKGDPVIIGMITFFCSFIPFLGVLPVSLALVASQFFESNYLAMSIFIIFGIMASCSDNLVRAWVIGNRTRIHPLVAFISVIGAVQVIGLFGIFIGPVVAALFMKVFSLTPVNQER